MLFIYIKLHFQARPLLSMFILKIILQVSHNTKFLSMITWSQTLEEGTTQLQVNSLPPWTGYIFLQLDICDQKGSSLLHRRSSRWPSTRLVGHPWPNSYMGQFDSSFSEIQMKKGSEFSTQNRASYAAFIHNHYTFLTGYKISD